MQAKLYAALCFSVLASTIVGIARYRSLETSMRMIVAFLLLTCGSELCSYFLSTNKNFDTRDAVYHFYNIIQAFLISAYFIFAIKPEKNFKILIASAVVWPIIGILNALFLQPINSLNNNMLMVESFAFVTMSLYLIYRILQNEGIMNIFSYPHFLIAVLFLLLWSTSYFFWAFVKILYTAKWQHMQSVMYLQAVVNIIFYSGIGLVLFFYPKNKPIENR